MKAGLLCGVGEYVAMIEPNDTITVWRIGEEEPVAQEKVTNYGTSIFHLMSRDDAAIGWASFEDFEVLYFYQKEDGFGYALNIQDSWCSEWGYSPFPVER